MDTHTATAAPPPKGPADIPADPLERALADARTRGRDLSDRILSDPEMLTAQPFASAARLRRPSLDRHRKANLVIALKSELSGWRFPVWQLGADGKPFAAIPRLFEILGSAWAVYRFLIQHHPELEGATGLEALRAGRTAEVLDAAESNVTAFA
jgi:hypothetical protein